MRTTQTFVLHLLTDTDEPQALRGTLRLVASGEEVTFTDGPALLTLLCRMAQAIPVVAPTDEENEKGYTIR
ncbi:MAG: hypothetical protein N2508_10660 [Anaerolineae bacterium]|nr:hypothetical protein [Anaerolineae bacterium]